MKIQFFLFENINWVEIIVISEFHVKGDLHLENSRILSLGKVNIGFSKLFLSFI